MSFDRILKAASEPENWLTYSGGLASQRYSGLTQITPANVRNLELQWAFQALSLEKFEATPLVVDGVLYTVQAPNDIVAIDPVSGRTFWTYAYKPSPQARPCCGRVNRGVAILGDDAVHGHDRRPHGRRGQQERPRAVERGGGAARGPRPATPSRWRRSS